jgi:tRNA threonylcarbamoyladenosine modification (KEOPS) complex  Pcc1 subunit
MTPTAKYDAQMTAAETALALARNAGDIAAMLAALSTMTRLVRLQYGAAKLAS